MTDSESPDATSTDGDDGFSFANEDFDFSDVGVTEEEYYDRLDEIAAVEFVDDLSHSLVLNEVAVAIDPDFTGRIDAAVFGADITIRHVGEWTTKDETDDRLCLELSTTRVLCPPDDADEYFPGEYDPEAMAALSVELDLFAEVADVDAIESASGETLVDAALDGEMRSTFLFDDVMTFLGYDIREVWLGDGTVERVRFGFSERRVWSRDEAYAQFQSSKASSYRSALLDASDPVRLPCGHVNVPTIAMVQDLHRDGLVGFPTVMVGDDACHEVPVDDATSAFLTVAEWPDDIVAADCGDDFIATAIARGYTCEACDVFYPFVDADAASADRTPSGETQESGAVVTLGDTEYVFTYVPIAARPVGHHDAWVADHETA